MTSHTPHDQDKGLALRFYQTLPHPCSYLANQEATTLFLDPQHPPTPEIYDALSLAGFRRSGQNLYRPHCQQCQACQSVRIPVNEFAPNRQQRKIANRNRDLIIECSPATFNAEHYALYQHYIEARHADGDMYPPSEEQYRSFLNLDQDYAMLASFRAPDSGQLLAVAAIDQLGHGLSAIYTFFAPNERRRSLGVFAVLWQIERAKQLKLPYLYLGYWISECRKMRYKSQYQPMEVLQGQRWIKMPPFKNDSVIARG